MINELVTTVSRMSSFLEDVVILCHHRGTEVHKWVVLEKLNDGESPCRIRWIMEGYFGDVSTLVVTVPYCCF